MKPKWQDIVADEKEQRVFKALENPRWDFRTKEGIAREAGLPLEEVAAIIDKHLATGLIRESLVIRRPGHHVYTLGQKNIQAEEAVRFIQQSISKSIK